MHARVLLYTRMYTNACVLRANAVEQLERTRRYLSAAAVKARTDKIRAAVTARDEKLSSKDGKGKGSVIRSIFKLLYTHHMRT